MEKIRTRGMMSRPYFTVCKKSTDPDSFLKFFAETACFTENEVGSEEKARDYLYLWKEMLIKKFDTDFFKTYDYVGEQEITREGDGKCGWIILKVWFQERVPYELPKVGEMT